MKKIEIFDPAMCCPTGICGPGVDQELLRIATTIATLKHMGITVKRYGLSSEPQAFVANKSMAALLQSEGVDSLPVTLIDGDIVKKGSYPTKAEIEAWLGIEIKAPRRKSAKSEE